MGKRLEGNAGPHSNAYGSARTAFTVEGFLASMIASARAWGVVKRISLLYNIVGALQRLAKALGSRSNH